MFGFTLLFFFISMCWGIVLIFSRLEDDENLKWFAKKLTPIFLLFIFLQVINIVVSIWFGIYPNYQNGIREGYLTKVGERGAIFKTTEIEIQMGTGYQATIENIQKLSTNDSALTYELKNNIGKHVRIRYNEWFILPLVIGETSYQITSIEEIK